MSAPSSHFPHRDNNVGASHDVYGETPEVYEIDDIDKSNNQTEEDQEAGEEIRQENQRGDTHHSQDQ